MHPESKCRIVVFRTGHLGDTVCALPAFRLLRKHFSEPELVLLCDQPTNGKVAAVEIARLAGIFDSTETYQSRRGVLSIIQLVSVLRRTRPRTIVILPSLRDTQIGVTRKKRFFRLCGVPVVLGFQPEPIESEWQPNEADRLLGMLNNLGITGRKPSGGFPIDLKAKGEVVHRLQSIGIKCGQAFLVFCGGGKAPTQRWDLEKYATVLGRVAKALCVPIVGIGSRAEVGEYDARILPRFPKLNILESLSLSELIELLRLSLCYLGNDTGPMHLAAAVKCPVAAVFSARNLPGTWDPDVEQRLVIRNRTTCENCFLFECANERHRCMTDITTERVVSEVLPFVMGLMPKR